MPPKVAVAASAATLAPPQIASQPAEKAPPFMTPVTETQEGLSAAGFTFIRNLGRRFFVNSEAAPSVGIVLGLEAADGIPTALEEATLGQLSCNRFLACARIKIYWMTPEWGGTAKELPPETQFLLLQLSPSGPYAAVLPLIDSGAYRATLRPPRKGQDSNNDMRLRIESGDANVKAKKWDHAVLVAAGYDPYDLIDSAVAAAADFSGGAKPRVAKQRPEFVDSFGWCTWDAFYSKVSAEGIHAGLESMKEGGVPPRLLITDDGWQSTDLDAALRPPTSEAVVTEHEVLKAAAKATAKDSTSALAELANEAYVPDLHASQHTSKKEAHAAALVKAEQKGKLASAWDHVKGFFAGILAVIITHLYMWFIEHAPPQSGRIKWFTRLSEGKLRPVILHFYAQTSDHVKRLMKVTGNGKFSRADAGPDESVNNPEALAAVVTDLRERFNLKHVFCWHSLYGYWAGIAPDSQDMAKYSPKLVWPQPTGGVLDVDPCFAWNCQVVAGVGVVSNIGHLYRDMHSYLAGAGVDGVKVDCQSTLDMIGSSLGGGAALAAEYHAALEDSVATNFPGNSCINCMCHSTNNLYRMSDTVLARSSDDFWPRDPASHTTHVAVNALNSLFMAPLVQPDWDMFHSQHPAALLHASARVVSGGPVYVSDRPGQHDFDLLKRVVLPDGSVLLCTQPGRPTADCLFSDVMRDKHSLLKVWNTNKSGSGVIGIFNVQGSYWCRTRRQFVTRDSSAQTLTTRVRPADVPTFTADERGGSGSGRFVMYSDAQQTAWVLGPQESVSVRLSRGESDLLTVVELAEVKGLSIAPIGLTNMLNTGASVLRFACEPAVDSHSVSASVTVRGCGRLRLHCTAAPSRCAVDGVPAQFKFDADSCSLTMSVPRNEGLVSEVSLEFTL